MKKIVLMLVAGLITSLTYAQKIQDNDVPVVVKNAFQKQYPTAKEVKWEKENVNYEVNFDLNEVDYSVLMDEKGTILETEIEIELSQLPAGVLDYVKANYAGQKVKECSKITDVKSVITYEVEIKGKDLIFDNNGKFVKETKD
jgi:hypothetical protein